MKILFQVILIWFLFFHESLTFCIYLLFCQVFKFYILNSVTNLYFFVAFPSDDRYRPSLKVYPGGGNDYINAVIVVVNI